MFQIFSHMCILAIVIAPQNPDDVSGWFNRSGVNLCKRFTGDKLIRCIEKHSYFPKHMNVSFPHSLDKAKYFYLNKFQSVVSLIDAKPGKITHGKPSYSLRIMLDNRLQYSILIIDPKMLFISESSPDLNPGIHLQMKPLAHPMIVYMTVKSSISLKIINN